MKRLMGSMGRVSGIFAAIVFVAGLVGGEASATPVLPEGTAITGSPTSLLGFDLGANDYFAGGVSAVNDQNIEFLTDDFALFIDFQSDGLLRLFDNLGTGDDVFDNTLQFSFSGLGFSLTGIQPLDLSALTAGKLLFNIIDANTIELSMNDVQFSPGFSHLDLQLAVDEPSMLALFVFGLLGVYFARRYRFDIIGNAEVTP